jgi:hypothetical protein
VDDISLRFGRARDDWEVIVTEQLPSSATQPLRLEHPFLSKLDKRPLILSPLPSRYRQLGRFAGEPRPPATIEGGGTSVQPARGLSERE